MNWVDGPFSVYLPYLEVQVGVLMEPPLED